MSLCAFCHTGRREEPGCGTLRYYDGFQAHHKCLQYSSGLAQYWGASLPKEYGGFKPENVQKEIKRAGSLMCYICKKKKLKDKKCIRGASAGCAWKACKKSFHIPCANKDADALVCRIVANRGGRRIHLYRVFCGNAHQKRYEDVEMKHLDEFEYNSESDDNHQEENEGISSESSEDDAAKNHESHVRKLSFKSQSTEKLNSTAVANGKLLSPKSKSASKIQVSASLFAKARKDERKSSSDGGSGQSRRLKKFNRAPTGRGKSTSEETPNLAARRELLESSSGSSSPLLDTPQREVSLSHKPSAAKKRKKCSPRQVAISNYFTQLHSRHNNHSDASSDSETEQMSPVIPYMHPMLLPSHLMMDIRNTPPVIGTVYSPYPDHTSEQEMTAISDQLSNKSEDVIATPNKPKLTSSPAASLNGMHKHSYVNDNQQPTTSGLNRPQRNCPSIYGTPLKNVVQAPGPVQYSPRSTQAAGNQVVDNLGNDAAMDGHLDDGKLNSQQVTDSQAVNKSLLSTESQSFSDLPPVSSLSFSQDSSFNSQDFTGALCIVEGDCMPQDLAAAVQLHMGVTLHLTKIYKSKPLKRAELLYYFMDLAVVLSKGMLDEARELIIGLSDEETRRYKDQAELEELWSTLHQDAVQILKRKSWEKIVEDLRVAEEQHQIVAGLHHVGNANQRTLILMLTDTVDPDKQIVNYFRSKKVSIHMWSPNTSILMPLPDKTSPKRLRLHQREVNIISSWLESVAPADGFCIHIRPEEGLLVDSEHSSVCTEVKDLFKDRGNPSSSRILLAILPVKKDLMNFQHYVQSVLQAFVENQLTASNEIYCMLDVGSVNGMLKFDDILPDVPDDWLVSVFSAADPATHPITCAVLHISKAASGQ